MKQTRCIGCGLSLELPTVHFLCGHSYHKACISNDNNHCPKCEIVKEEKTMIDEASLLSDLKRSRDGFAFVAECFGKNLFRNEVEVEEAPVEEEEVIEDVEDIPMQTLEL